MKKETSSISIKRVLSLVVALVMVLAMSIPAFAATSDANMTNSYSQWTLEVAPGDSVTLYASPANASYTPTGFNTDATTADVAWSSSNDAIASVDQSSVGFETAPSNISGLSGIWCTKAIVKVPASAEIGSCSIEAKNAVTGSSVNFTILVKSAATANAENVSVYLPDYSVTLDAGTVYHTTTNFATPMDALKQLKADAASGFSYEGSESYISSITYKGDKLSEYTEVDPDTGKYIYYGWNYRVYRKNGNDSYLVADSSVIAANAFQLKNDDTIVWMWGTADAAKEFFADKLSDLYA